MLIFQADEIIKDQISAKGIQEPRGTFSIFHKIVKGNFSQPLENIK